MRKMLQICLVLLVCKISFSQNFRGGLSGEVQDSAGARITNAIITLQPVESPSNGVRSISVGPEASFRFDDLLPGAYRITVVAPGFAPAVSNVRVLVSSARELHVRLQPAVLRQSVTVSAQQSSITSPAFDSTSATHQAIITTQDLTTLPLAERSFANIAFLAPGTEPVEPSDPTKARITAVSTGGSSGLNTELSVDGVDNSDDYIGGFLQNFSPDAVQEFAVRTAQEDTDTARTTGASVVISTRRGTDRWHGGAAFYERSASLNARFPIDNPSPDPKQPFSRQNYVATAGGPILPHRLWFFTSFEMVQENASIAYSPASLAQFGALAQLASGGLIPGVRSIDVAQNVSVPFHDALGTLRVDWEQTDRSQWFLRAGVDTYITRNAFVQQSALPTTGATSHNNYVNLVLNHQFQFTPTWLGTAVLGAGGLHLTEARTSTLGFALAFPFTSTSSTISGLETFGDNQFVTPISAFPVRRDQQKYQLRYDIRHSAPHHAASIGASMIHEPVLGGALAATQETLVSFPQDPIDYLANPARFAADYAAGSATTPAGNGSFSQNVQRLGLFAEDSWRANSSLLITYGLRWDTTFGLFRASGQSQATNPALLTLRSLSIPIAGFSNGVPAIAQDDRAQIAPRLGVAYSPGTFGSTVLRAGIGLYFNDLAQNGWVGAFQAVNSSLSGSCSFPGDQACLPPAATAGPVGTIAGSGVLIDPHYSTPYALHVTGGIQHTFSSHWTGGADFTHEEGNHAFRRYQYEAGYTLFSPLFGADVETQRSNVPNLTVLRTDNRSSYNALMIHVDGSAWERLSLTANYTLARASTWGCVLGELFDYVNGVCNPLHAFAPGDYGPSGEDVRHRLVLAGGLLLPGGIRLSTLTQAESARPFTLTTTVPTTGVGDGFDNRAVVNGTHVALDSLRGTPYVQVDMRVGRPTTLNDTYTLTPFVEFFNLLNRNNPGANYVTNLAALPVPQFEVQAGNVTDLCNDRTCSTTRPITSPKQLRIPGGALGDFFGPGTTVGVPFAAQIGLRLSF